VENGPALEVPRSVLDKLKLKIGDKMPVSLHQGPLFDWGFIKPARSS
jgi:antitoxin component of MazEF toxin-antitoxin module